MISGVNAPLQAFPPGRPDAMTCTASLAMQVISLRLATSSDLPFMRALYGSLRADELAQVPWPEDTRRAFLDSQFALQHRHFVTAYANADFYIVQTGDLAIGRYYLLRHPPHYLVVDIALLPTWRGQGIGTKLLAWTQELVQRDIHAIGVDLHVDERNTGAQRLYSRLGFKTTTQQPPYFGMRWSSEQTDQLNTA
jgi:ribosomal protein S18 acetylase RimI-like enzyme